MSYNIELKRRILEEIKKILNEADPFPANLPEPKTRVAGGSQGMVQTGGISDILKSSTAKGKSPEELAAILKGINDSNYVNVREAQAAYLVVKEVNTVEKALRFCKAWGQGPIILDADFQTSGEGQQYKANITIIGNWITKTCREEQGARPNPAPRPPTSDDRTGPGNISFGVKDVPQQELKAQGCRPGTSFIGKNAITQGPQVKTLQTILGMLFKGRGFQIVECYTQDCFKYKGVREREGIYGPGTEQMLLDFQGEYGSTYAPKIKSELGVDNPLNKQDGCAGPKTACALLLSAKSQGLTTVDQSKTILGLTANKCIQKLGQKKGKQTASADSGEGNIAAESKNWLDRTREKTTSNLFERLVKDTANKKVI